MCVVYVLKYAHHRTNTTMSSQFRLWKNRKQIACVEFSACFAHDSLSVVYLCVNNNIVINNNKTHRFRSGTKKYPHDIFPYYRLAFMIHVLCAVCACVFVRRTFCSNVFLNIVVTCLGSKWKNCAHFGVFYSVYSITKNKWISMLTPRILVLVVRSQCVQVLHFKIHRVDYYIKYQ